MLNTLKKYTRKEAQSILSAFALSLLPNPQLQEPVYSSSDAELFRRIAEEVRQKASIDDSDNSPEARGKLLESLSSEMSQYAMWKVDTRPVEARIGQRGDLPTTQYNIEFGKEFRLEDIGLSLDVIIAAVLQPDAVQHLQPSELYRESAWTFSVKNLEEIVAGQDSAEHYVLFVQSLRQGKTQKVTTAWRVYDSDVDLSQAREPFDILRAFVDVYGGELTIEGEQPRKLILYSNSVKAGANGQAKIDYKGIGIYGHAYKNCFFMRVNEDLLTMEIALAYTIDMTHYTSDLRKHGIDGDKNQFNQQGYEVSQQENIFPDNASTYRKVHTYQSAQDNMLAGEINWRE